MRGEKMMTTTEGQPPNESTKSRGSGGDIQSKGLSTPDTEGTDSREEPESEAEQGAPGRATTKKS
jgi:hypothetical protein